MQNSVTLRRCDPLMKKINCDYRRRNMSITTGGTLGGIGRCSHLSAEYACQDIISCGNNSCIVLYSTVL